MGDAVQTREIPAAEPATPASYRHFVIAAVVYLLLYQCAVLLTGLPMALSGQADLRSFYGAAFMVRTGKAASLYDLDLQEKAQRHLVPKSGALPFLYPAFAALPFVPFSYLGWRAAYWLFFLTNLGLLGLSARLIRGSLPHLSQLWRPLPLLLFFVFFPAGEALMQGQSSILLLTLYCAAFYSLQKGRPFRAGLFAGLAILKIQTALPIFLLFLLWRRWRFVAGFLTTATAALATSLWVTGYSAFIEYWRSLFLMAASSSGSTAHFCIPPEMMANLFGLAHLVTGGAAWSARLAAAASLLLILWMASRPASLPMAIIVALLLSRYLGIHDLVLLLPPVLLALEYVVAHLRERRAQATGILCLLLLLPPVYLSALGHRLVDGLAIVLLAFLFCCALLQHEPSQALLAPIPEALPGEVS